MKNGTSLATKFIIMLLIILFIGQGLGFILFILSIRDNMLDSLNENMRRTGSLLAGLSIRPILDNDDVLLNTYLEEIIKDEDFISLTVLDNNKNLIGEKTKIFPEESLSINPFYVGPFLKSETPVFLKDKKIGDITITSSSKRINDELFKRMVSGVIYQGILSVVIILLVWNFFNRDIRRPISDFDAAVSKVGTGDLTVTIQPKKNMEMMMLTKGFTSLTARLKNIVQKLYSTTNDVTMAIKQINFVADRIAEKTNNQVDATEEVISAIEKAGESQRRVLDSTHNLMGFSQENLSSLTQVKSATEEINEKTKQLFQPSLEVYSSIGEMLAAAKKVIKNTEKLLVSTEETSSAVEQINASLKEVESSTKESERLATEVEKVLSDVEKTTLNDAVNSMGDVEVAVNKNLELVRNLETKSKDVEKILNVVNDVTKQTNLLSVNAAVLAAQAGEYGTGFAIVGDEIKTLADRTASSAKEITNIIKSIQGEIAEAIHVTENSKRIVKDSKDLIIKMSTAIDNVLERAQKSSEMTKTIQRATEEQVKGIAQINEAMDMITVLVARVTETVRGQENKSGHLLDNAEKLKEISEIIGRIIQEQNTGIDMISRNLEFTNKIIEGVDDATSKQGKTNKEILDVANKIKIICNDTLTITQEMAASFNNLYKETETIKKDMEGFKLA